MVYIVVLNWNNYEDTVRCIQSLSFLTGGEFKIVVCDNASTDNSFLKIKHWFDSEKMGQGNVKYFEEKDINPELNIGEGKFFLIKNKKNWGYAGGNNVGIRFALSQVDMNYIWILNNDTEVEPESLRKMLDKCSLDPSIGICGSRLVYFHDKEKLQGFGGCYNSWTCSTKNYKWLEPSFLEYDADEIENNIDYVIGASMLVSRKLLEKVGLLCEDYFLYYEEIDICLRAKKYFKISVCVDSIVYHKEGASTNSGTSMIADYCSVRNRLLITKKFYPFKLPFVWLSLFLVLFNRIKRKEYKKARVVARIILSGK